MVGRVKFFNKEKGWGFITENSTNKDYYFHNTALLSEVIGGSLVEFSLVEGRKGQKAINVKNMHVELEVQNSKMGTSNTKV
jgi:CspA family cold shock protein